MTHQEPMERRNTGRIPTACIVLLTGIVLIAGVILITDRNSPELSGTVTVTRRLVRAGKHEPVTIAAVGDVLPGGMVGTSEERAGLRDPLRRIAPVLREADIAFCNLECPLSTRGSPTPLKTPEDLRARREFLFRGVTESASRLASAGVDVVSLANNHMMDYGPDALEDTIESLESAGVRHSGAGEDLRAARSPVILTVGGTRVAVLSYVWAHTLPGTHSFEAGESRGGCAFLHADGKGRLSRNSIRLLNTDIRIARCLVDVVLVSMHWGIEKEHRPLPAQRSAARLVLDLGADAVLGHHPHVLQGIEVYKGKPIAYSLGNFVFPSRRDPNNDTCILLLTLGGREARVEAIPARIEHGIPRLVTGEESARIARFISALSAELGTPSTISSDGRLVVSLSSERADQ